MAITKTDVYNVQAPFPLDLRTVVATLNDRDALVMAQRFEGLPVYVTAEQKVYRLIGGTENEDWVQVWPFGGTGSVTINTAAPTGGNDGDIWFRQEGNSVRVYQKIEGAWTDLGIFTISAPIPTLQQVAGAGATSSIPLSVTGSGGTAPDDGLRLSYSSNNNATILRRDDGVNRAAIVFGANGDIDIIGTPINGNGGRLTIFADGGAVVIRDGFDILKPLKGGDATEPDEFATLGQIGRMFTHVASGDGTTYEFSVPHGLPYTPTMVLGTANTEDSYGSSGGSPVFSPWYRIEGANVVISYHMTAPAPPPSGTNNLKWTILVK